MPKFRAIRAFQCNGQVIKEGEGLSLSDAELKDHMDMGKHPDNEKPMSPVLNHCQPADEETSKKCAGFVQPFEEFKPPTPEEKKAALDKIRKEFDGFGIAYDKRWSFDRMKKELVKAKKEKGL